MHIRDYKYTAEDVDCRYCTEFRHGRCGAIKCPWLNERIEAGVISYHDAVNESFSSRSPLLRRIRLVSPCIACQVCFANSPLTFRSLFHKSLIVNYHTTLPVIKQRII